MVNPASVQAFIQTRYSRSKKSPLLRTQWLDSFRGFAFFCLFTLIQVEARAQAAGPVSPPASPSVPSPGTNRVLNLSESLHLALERSPVHDSARRQLEISRWQKKNAVASLLPSLDLAAAVGAVDTAPVDRTTPYTSSLSLTLQENLYDNGESWNQLSQARIGERLADLNYARTRDRLIVEIADRFLRLQLARRLEEAQKNQLDLIRKQFRLISSQYRSGMKTRTDFIRFEAQLKRAEIDLISARNRTLSARENLIETMGLTTSEANSIDFEAPTERPQGRLNVPAAEPRFESHYEWRIADLQRQVNRLGTELVSRRYWPELGLRLSASQTYTDFIDTGTQFNDAGQTRAEALLTLTYNIWDWGLRRRNVQIARAQETIASNSLETTLLSTRNEIRQLMLELRQLQENDRLTDELLRLEEQNFAFIDRQYREGRLSYLELINALSDLLDAKTRFFNARTDLQIALFRYRYHEGTLYDSIPK